MNAAVVDPDVEAVLDRFDSAMDDLLTLPLDSLTDDDLVAFLRRFETGKRRLPVVDHRLIEQAQTRNLDFAHGATSLADFLKQVLRICGREATARVHAAEAAGPRTALAGEPLPPIYEHVAAAQAAGSISPGHAQVIVFTVDHLPGKIQKAVGPTVEQILVQRAGELNPEQLGRHARDVARALDPDGRFKDAEHRDRQRGLRVRYRADGSVSGSFEAPRSSANTCARSWTPWPGRSLKPVA